MFESIIAEIYYDNCGQWEKIRSSRLYEQPDDKLEEYHRKLIAGLTEEQKGWLEKILELDGAKEAESSFTNDRAGVRFGLRLAVEASGYVREGDNEILDGICARY